MSESETDREVPTAHESGEESIDDTGRNPTQRRIDGAGESEGDEPVDAPWGSEDNESL